MIPHLITYRNFIFILSIPFLFGCKDPNKYECPCGGYGVVAHGTIITIDEKNAGDEEAIIDAIEKRLGGECCDLSSLPPPEPNHGRY